MTLLRIKAIVFLVLASAAVIGAHAWRPTEHLSDSRAKVNLETLFPKAFGDWRVDDGMPVQLVSPDQQAVLSKIYNQLLSRTYTNSRGERIMLSVAYGGDQSDATRAHRPEVCYPAQGFQIDSSTDTALSLNGHPLRVRQLVSRLGGRVEPITYWVTVGDQIALSGTEQKLAQLSYSTRGVVPDGMLVRVSNISSNPDQAFPVHQNFLTELVKSIPPEFQNQVVGQPGA